VLFVLLAMLSGVVVMLCDAVRGIVLVRLRKIKFKDLGGQDLRL
jgi:hypothetical protein